MATGKQAQVQQNGAARKKASPEERRFRLQLKARNTLIWVVTEEERRAERVIATGAANEGYEVRYWDCATGAVDIEGKKIQIGGGDLPDTNPHSVFDAARGSGAVWIMRDLPALLDDAVTLRALKSLARDLQDELVSGKEASIVVLSAVAEVPLALRSSAVVLDWPLPTRAVTSVILDVVLEGARVTVNGASEKLTIAPAERERVIDAAAGLGSDDIANAFSLSIATHGKLDPAEISRAKKSIIDRAKLLTWHEPDPRGLDAIGGLALLKAWLSDRKAAWTPEARAYGLPPVKGVLLSGPSGTGKSLTAKCAAAAFGVPLLRMDLGALKGGIVGQSEANIRGALKTAEAVQKCVLWCDEIGRTSLGQKGSLDSGVSDDQVGTILTWSEECQLPIFIIGTCNDPSGLPPELISRFDEVFFVDLPTRSERVEILQVTLEFLNRSAADFDLPKVAEATAGFSGRELKKMVGGAMFLAFNQGGREVETDDLLLVASHTTPVSKGFPGVMPDLWQRARRASHQEVEATTAGGGFQRLLTVSSEED